MNDTSRGIGDNRPPPYDPDILAALDAKAREIADAAGDWMNLGEITTEEDAQRLNDLVGAATKVEKAIEEARKTAKQPHMDAGKAVDEAFKAPAGIVTRAKDHAKRLLGAFLQRKQEAARREQERQQREAREAAEDAALLAAQALARNDIVGQVTAEEAKKRADDLAKAAALEVKANVQSASGAGRTISLRTQVSAKITSDAAVFMHFRDHPDVREVLQRLANAALRAGDAVPGTERVEVQVAA